jgi:hypothetical protein
MLGTSKLLPTSACVEVSRQDSCLDISSTYALLDGIQSWYCIESIKISQTECVLCANPDRHTSPISILGFGSFLVGCLRELVSLQETLIQVLKALSESDYSEFLQGVVEIVRTAELPGMFSPCHGELVIFGELPVLLSEECRKSRVMFEVCILDHLRPPLCVTPLYAMQHPEDSTISTQVPLLCKFLYLPAGMRGNVQYAFLRVRSSKVPFDRTKVTAKTHNEDSVINP